MQIIWWWFCYIKIRTVFQKPLESMPCWHYVSQSIPVSFSTEDDQSQLAFPSCASCCQMNHAANGILTDAVCDTRCQNFIMIFIEPHFFQSVSSLVVTIPLSPSVVVILAEWPCTDMTNWTGRFAFIHRAKHLGTIFTHE